MAFNAINQAHQPQLENAQTLSSSKTQSGTPKANTANSAAKESQTGGAQGTPTATAAENNAGGSRAIGKIRGTPKARAFMSTCSHRFRESLPHGIMSLGRLWADAACLHLEAGSGAV